VLIGVCLPVADATLQVRAAAIVGDNRCAVEGPCVTC
jgi:hypothetical protein